MAENVKIVPASCTQCGGTVEVDPNSEKAVCPFCGTSFIVEKAINNYTVEHATIEHADNVKIDMTGSVKSVLDFVGDQMKESREERRQARKEAYEREHMVRMGFFKMFGVLFAVMMVVAIVYTVYERFFDPDDGTEGIFYEEVYSEDSVISGHIDSDGFLSVNINDPGEYEWNYDSGYSSETLSGMSSDFDGYHFTVKPSHENSVGYAVVCEYEEGTEAYGSPNSVGIVKFRISSQRVTEILEVSHLSSISEYSFTY
ncbi:MAG: hypothetical protein K6E91_08485 [Butyrivibrio sp.]|nr:hypothetical protein [Butyrivibrio sp.]